MISTIKSTKCKAKEAVDVSLQNGKSVPESYLVQIRSFCLPYSKKEVCVDLNIFKFQPMKLI